MTSTPGTEPVSHIHHTLGHAHTDTAMDAGTNRAQMLAHGRTWPDGRTRNTAADLRSCWSAAVVCWWWMVAPTGFEPALPP